MNKSNKKLKLAIICSGGNSPGMNNAVIGFAKKCAQCNIDAYYFLWGYKGITNNDIHPCNLRYLEEFTNRGNTIIGSGRLPAFATDVNVRKKAVKNLKKNGIDCLLVVGGEGSYQGAYKLSQLGAKVIAIPATIDNDVNSTQYTIGFDTCLNQVSKLINDITDCFSSHDGINLIEIMGRACPDLTINTGIGSNIYMVTKYNILKTEDFIKIVKHCKSQGKRAINFVVTEKIYGTNNLPTLASIAKKIEATTGHMTRVTTIGYIQRGGTPSARDRLIANYLVDKAVDLAKQGIFNKAVGINNKQIVAIELKRAVTMKRKSHNRYLVNKFNKINLQ